MNCLLQHRNRFRIGVFVYEHQDAVGEFFAAQRLTARPQNLKRRSGPNVFWESRRRFSERDFWDNRSRIEVGLEHADKRHLPKRLQPVVTLHL